jgi:hypothetical protein
MVNYREYLLEKYAPKPEDIKAKGDVFHRPAKKNNRNFHRPDNWSQKVPDTLKFKPFQNLSL